MGMLRYNASNSMNYYEQSPFKINTSKYSEEPHLYFKITAVGSYKHRSAEPNEYQLYNLSVTNIGDTEVQNNTWDVTLQIPIDCNVADISDSGTFDSGARLINWSLEELNVSYTKIYNFTMNCSSTGMKVLFATAINDTRKTIIQENNSVNIGCSGVNCKTNTNYSFFIPSSNLRYPRLSRTDFYISYNWTGEGISIGQIGAAFGSGKYNNLIWQDYTMMGIP